MGFVEDGYDSAPAAYRAMAGNFVDLYTRTMGTVASPSVTW